VLKIRGACHKMESGVRMRPKVWHYNAASQIQMVTSKFKVRTQGDN